MKKIVVTIGLCLCMITFSGCKGKVDSLTISQVKKETLLIRSDGTVQLGASEAFSQAYYDEGDLEEFISAAIEEFNDEYGKDSVTLESFTIDDNKAKAIFTYDTIEHYCEMNQVEAATYTVKEAEEAGILTGTFTNAVEGTKADLDDVKENEDYKVIVINTAIRVKVPDTIKYYSNAMLVSQDTVETTGEDEAVIVYK